MANRNKKWIYVIMSVLTILFICDQLLFVKHIRFRDLHGIGIPIKGFLWDRKVTVLSLPLMVIVGYLWARRYSKFAVLLGLSGIMLCVFYGIVFYSGYAVDEPLCGGIVLLRIFYGIAFFVLLSMFLFLKDCKRNSSRK